MYLNKEHIIIMPTYNDGESLNKLILNINRQIKTQNTVVKILIVNDGSSKQIKIDKQKFNNIKTIKILNLYKNFGNQFAIAIGLKYLKNKIGDFTIIVMDSDGEDNPNKLNLLLKNLKKNQNKFIVASRSKRTEKLFLRFLNHLRLLFTFIFTGRYLNFGNFSCFSSKKLNEIVNKREIFLAYCSTLMNTNSVYKVPIQKNKRYYGSSKVNLKFLILYSLKILSVFNLSVFSRSILILFVVEFIRSNYFYDSMLLSIIFIFVALLNFFIFYLFFSQKNIVSYKKYIDKEIKIK